MKLKYFNIQDFDSPDDPGSGTLMDKIFTVKRETSGTPYIINCKYTPHNKSVGGKLTPVYKTRGLMQLI